MRGSWRADGLCLLILLGMAVAGALAWPHLPERVPMHWGLTGGPDRYGSRLEAVLLVPGVTLGVYLLMLLAPRIDPRSANYPRFAGVYAFLRFLFVAFMGAMQGALLANGLGLEVPVNRVALVGLGALLVLLGNSLGKVQPNWFVGIRTPWTLTSTLSWRRTHRLGGWLFVMGGLLWLGAGLWGAPLAIYLAVGLSALGLVGLLAYSYLVWRQDPERGNGPTAGEPRERRAGDA